MLLGIDVGTTNTKIAIYNKRGKVLAQAKALTVKGKAPDGHLNYLPEKIWQTTARLIKQAVKEAGVAPEAMAVSSMGETGAPLDEALEPTYPAIPWYDEARTLPQLQALTERFKPERWYPITGLYPSPIHSVFKWVWLKERYPEAWAKTRLWLSMADYIGFRLTGEAVMEAGQAARTMAYDVVKASWSEQILNACGLEPGFLPPVRVATTPLGGVSKEAAKLTGLAEAMPVFVGGHDHFCAAFASGALSPDIAMDSYGTAEAFTLGFKGKPDPAKAGAFAVGPHVLPGYSYLLGGIYSSGGAVAWLRDLLKLEYQTLPKLAATVRPGDAPLFIAEFHGAAPPFNVPKASGVFIELIPEHSQAHLARAIYEGIAFELKMNIEGLEQVTRQTIECIRMVGGAGSLPLWSKIRASIYQRPIEIAAHDDMVTLGVALLAGLGAGIYQNPAEAIRQTFRIQKVIQPDPAWQASYEQPYTRYKRYIQALRVVQED